MVPQKKKFNFSKKYTVLYCETDSVLLCDLLFRFAFNALTVFVITGMLKNKASCIFKAVSTYMGLPQGSTGRAHCGKAQCQTHCTASLEKLVYYLYRALCYRSGNAFFHRYSTCPQILACGKEHHT